VDVCTADENNTLEHLQMGYFAGLTETTTGKVILLMGQYAHNPQASHTIHASNQIRFFGHKLDDVPHVVGGKQRLHTTCGKIIPLHTRNGLVYMDMTYPTDDDLESYPHVILTHEEGWEPDILDAEFDKETMDTRVSSLVTIQDNWVN